MLRVLASSLLCLVSISIINTGSATNSPTPRSTVTIERAWARATPPGLVIGAAYAVITNRGAADRLLAVETSASKRVEIHSTKDVEGRMQMRQLATLDLPAGGAVAFEPGGLHLMLVDLQQPLQAGTTLSLTFVFEKAGRVTIEANVAPIGSTQPPALDTSHHAHH
ncbi:MAG TPA: copper chaperone PCu(A)C [Steroidobacter sp.]|nr:copper chaperone PCu(A)C [Steroidobacter sp.]